MSTRRTRIALACIIPLAAALVFVQSKVDATRAIDQGEDLLYLPNEKLLDHFTAGMGTIVADFIWLECVNYTARQAKGDGNLQWLNHMVNTVVRLDPYFTDVYRFGGMFLAGLDADDEAGLDLLKRGIVLNTKSWELPYEAALIYLLNRADEPGSKEIAALYLSMSAGKVGAPELVRDTAEKLQGEFNLTELERGMWTNMLENPDALLRDVAERKLAQMDIQEFLDDYRQANGISPKQVADQNSPDALGGRFFVDDNGHIQNTTLLDNEKSNILKILRRALGKFHKQNGQWPPDLQTITNLNLLPAIPPHPYPNQQWAYNPETGDIQ